MNIKGNFLDGVISYINPEAGAKRVASRVKAAVMADQIRKFDAASYGRRTKDWFAPPTSVNRETEISLYTLRNRARELVRNNPFARRAIQAISVNSIGLGIRPSMTVKKGLSVSASQLVKLKDDWTDWAESTDCDYDNKQNFYGLQDLAVRCFGESGEVLIRRRWTSKKGLTIPLQLQVLEPDFIDHTKNSAIGFIDNDGGYNIQGVRFDKDGIRIGYWLYSVHPGEGAYSTSHLVPEEEILHVFDKERAGQVRGIPMLTTSALTLRDFDEYEQAQLVRQKIAACFAVFIQDPDRDITPGEVSTAARREKLEPGIMEYLPAGKTMTFANPPTVQNYDEYATSILRKAAAGIGISYEMLTADLSNVNFSSGRMGWIEAHRLIQRIQMLILVPQLCNPVWKWFVEASIIVGRTKDSALKIKCKWTPPRREMIDPVKESKAMIDMIRAGLMSYSDAGRQQGQDPETLMEEVISDLNKIRDNELYLICDPLYDATRTNGALPEEDNGTDDDLTGKQKKKLKKRGMVLPD
jgi:lambda family phage portal protein